jgi:hypothetical protein
MNTTTTTTTNETKHCAPLTGADGGSDDVATFNVVVADASDEPRGDDDLALLSECDFASDAVDVEVDVEGAPPSSVADDRGDDVERGDDDSRAALTALALFSECAFASDDPIGVGVGAGSFEAARIAVDRFGIDDDCWKSTHSSSLGGDGYMQQACQKCQQT